MSSFPVILTINSGSSSIKFACFKAGDTPALLFSGKIDGIGTGDYSFTVTHADTPHTANMAIGGHNDIKDGFSAQTGADHGSSEHIPADGSDFHTATDSLFAWLQQQDVLRHVQAVGHRIVHGMRHTLPEIITPALLKDLKGISTLDPDHLPAEIELIERFTQQFPDWIQVACFDTAFHSTLPEVAKRFALPRRYFDRGIHRYGFHGLSYAYLMQALDNMVDPSLAKGRIILAHLGSGASITAVKDGQSIDTSMGFTPTGGLPMSDRAGDIDPGVAWYIMQEKGMTPQRFNHLINHESGLLGISGTTGDMQALIKAEPGDFHAAEAVDIFCYAVKKYIGAYMAALGGLDILIFSGGIGENIGAVRARICEGLQFAGIVVDHAANSANDTLISAKDSRVHIYVIPTNEELMIAQTTLQVLAEQAHTTSQ